MRRWDKYYAIQAIALLRDGGHPRFGNAIRIASSLFPDDLSLGAAMATTSFNIGSTSDIALIEGTGAGAGTTAGGTTSTFNVTQSVTLGQQLSAVNVNNRTIADTAGGAGAIGRRWRRRSWQWGATRMMGMVTKAGREARPGCGAGSLPRETASPIALAARG